MWTRLVRISDPGQWFGKIHEPVTRVQHLVRTNSYVNATVSLVRRYGAVVCMKKRELTQDPDYTLALQHVLDLLTWASYPGQIFPVWTQVNISDDNLMMWNTWTTDPGTICEHGLRYQTRSTFKKSCNCILYIEYCTYYYSMLEKEIEQENDRKKLCWCLTYQYVQLLIIIISIFPNTIFLCIDCNRIPYIEYILKCCPGKYIERDTVRKREKQTI